MTHQNENSQNDTAVQHILDNGLDGIAEAIRLVIDQAMKIERSQEANVAHPGGNGLAFEGIGIALPFISALVRLGLECTVAQVRGNVVYPSALEKGLRSERALKLAIAEMYVQGVYTRKVTAVLEQLCGLEISSTQVSRATAEMDLELAKWRTRPLGQFKYLIVDARYEKVRIDGTVRSCAVLIALGVDAQGQRRAGRQRQIE